jgi:hypothetical protein
VVEVEDDDVKLEADNGRLNSERECNVTVCFVSLRCADEEVPLYTLQVQAMIPGQLRRLTRRELLPLFLILASEREDLHWCEYPMRSCGGWLYAGLRRGCRIKFHRAVNSCLVQSQLSARRKERVIEMSD